MAKIGTTLIYYKIDFMAPPPYWPRLEGGVLQKAGDNHSKSIGKIIHPNSTKITSLLR